MACQDCFNNCDPAPVSDQCVKYTGADNTTLGIKFGNSLHCVQEQLIAYVLTLSNGSGITLEELSTDCAFLSDLIQEDLSLSNLLKAYGEALCSLKDSVTQLQPASFSFDVKCLTGVSATSSPNQLLQALITQLCALTTRVATIETSYVTEARVNTLIATYQSANTSVQQKNFMPRYVALPYHGSMDVFDAQGKGIATKGYDRVFVCNGQTVGSFRTPDYRGYSPIGANLGVPGGTLDAAADPALIQNAGYAIAQGNKKGNFTHTLSNLEQAPHTHSATQPPHFHYTASGVSSGTKGPGASDYIAWSSARANGNQDYDMCKTSSPANIGKTNELAPAITVSSAGGGQPHNNTHPVLGTVFIMYVP